MPSELHKLAMAVLARSQDTKGDTAWDSRGTVAAQVSLGATVAGTAKNHINQADDPSVPLSRVLGLGQRDSQQNLGHHLGQSLGQSLADPCPFAAALTALRANCPAYINTTDWQRATEDGDRFVSRWGGQAEALGWASADLFGLHTAPEKPAPNYRRLSRYDQTGLIWLLRGRPVIALTSTEAIIRCPSGASLRLYRRAEPAPATSPPIVPPARLDA